jgi:hypothetical protein
MQSGNLNFLHPSGPLQACNGTALTFTLGKDAERRDFCLTDGAAGKNIHSSESNNVSDFIGGVIVRQAMYV